ncbi:MAG: methyltransferase domain-containing protein [Anaerolineales bacterium]|nr:methyltransferase domain-containing protein [Anaerolineales bacterium]
MGTPASSFDSRMERWIQESKLPWMILKTDLGLHNLRKHLPGKPARILDAGGGSGSDALPLAREGHRIDLVDYSDEMLKAARAGAAREGLQTAIRFHPADVLQLDQLFPEPVFDAVVCHNVLHYANDAQALIRQLAAVLVPGGVLSLIGGNRHTIPYRTAFLAGDLDEAYRQIGSRNIESAIFKTTMMEYSIEEIRGMLPGAGLTFTTHYGIRCFADYWGDNETKLQPEVWGKISKLEYALTDKEPYNLLARFWQVIAEKMQGVRLRSSPRRNPGGARTR